MRELKFRAYFKSTKEMIYDVCSCYKRIHPNCNGFAVQYDPWFEKPDFIMQYTGLKDIKDKEIYEGDIIESHLKSVKKIIYFEDGFVACNFYDQRIGIRLTSLLKIKIIGNIYENPELLK